MYLTTDNQFAVLESVSLNQMERTMPDVMRLIREQADNWITLGRSGKVADNTLGEDWSRFKRFAHVVNALSWNEVENFSVVQRS